MCKNVLLIDDNEIDVFIGKRVIDLCEFAENIVVKNSCTDALEYLKENCENVDVLPEYIFLDLFMPVHDGYYFLSAFEKQPETVKKQCKIVLLTVLVDTKRIQQLRENVNVYAVLEKPLTEKSLNKLGILNNTKVDYLIEQTVDKN